MRGHTPGTGIYKPPGVIWDPLAKTSGSQESMLFMLNQFTRLLLSLGAAKPPIYDIFQTLINHYKESHRHYHNFSHIEAGLELFELVGDHLKHPDIIKCAWWFHDIIYIPSFEHNELASAEFAKTLLLQARIDEATTSKIYYSILFTNHTDTPVDSDTRFLLDVDLAILGEESEIFQTYEKQIRREFTHLSDEDFTKGRLQFIQQLLAKYRIYFTPLFQKHYEQQARKNLRTSYENLSRH